MTAQEAYAKFTSNPAQDTLAHLPTFRLARGNVIEIGVFDGASTSAFLCGVEEFGGHLHSIDINQACGEIFAKGHPQWTFINQDSKDLCSVLRKLPHGLELDFLFIDGDHGYDGCLSDLRNYAPLVRPGGSVFVHDIHHPEFPGVMAACRAYCGESGLAMGERSGSWGLGVIAIP